MAELGAGACSDTGACSGAGAGSGAGAAGASTFGDLIPATCSALLLKFAICEIVNRSPAMTIIDMIGILYSLNIPPNFVCQSIESVPLCSILGGLTTVFCLDGDTVSNHSPQFQHCISSSLFPF
jgi:hypothetical protein